MLIFKIVQLSFAWQPRYIAWGSESSYEDSSYKDKTKQNHSNYADTNDDSTNIRKRCTGVLI